MRAQLTRSVVVMSLLLGLPASGKAEPVSYGFTFIGEAAGPALDPIPALNDGGTVAFVGQQAGVFGVFVGNGGPVAFLPSPAEQFSSPECRLTMPAEWRSES